MSDWAAYEREKAEIARAGLSVEEYARAVRLLAERYGL